MQLPATTIVDGTLYTLTAFSVATWAIIAFKAVQFWHGKQLNHEFQAVFWDARDLAGAEKLAFNQTNGPKARIAREGFTWLAEIGADSSGRLRYWGERQELLERVLRRQLQEEQQSMERGLTPLASIGSTAPFVGLFGTVVGIMHALAEVGKAGNATLEVVAGPIGEALIATAIGIAVAVPAVLAYNFFLRRARLHTLALETFAHDFEHLVLNPAPATGAK